MSWSAGRLKITAAANTFPYLRRRHISPYTIRHTIAMQLLQAGLAISIIALWLGHESPTTTHHYVEADLAMKDARGVGCRSSMKDSPFQSA